MIRVEYYSELTVYINAQEWAELLVDPPIWLKALRGSTKCTSVKVVVTEEVRLTGPLIILENIQYVCFQFDHVFDPGDYEINARCVAFILVHRLEAPKVNWTCRSLVAKQFFRCASLQLFSFARFFGAAFFNRLHGTGSAYLHGGGSIEQLNLCGTLYTYINSVNLGTARCTGIIATAPVYIKIKMSVEHFDSCSTLQAYNGIEAAYIDGPLVYADTITCPTVFLHKGYLGAVKLRSNRVVASVIIALDAVGVSCEIRALPAVSTASSVKKWKEEICELLIYYLDNEACEEDEEASEDSELVKFENAYEQLEDFPEESRFLFGSSLFHEYINCTPTKPWHAVKNSIERKLTLDEL